MAAEVGKIQFKVGLKNQNGVKKEVQSLQNDVVNKLGSSFSKLGGLIAAAFSVSAIIGFSNECRKAYDTSVEMQTKLETIMRQRMNATNEEIERIRELNSVLQSQGVIEDDIAAAGAQQLSTFLNTSSALETLIPAMENLVAQQKGFNATAGDAVNVGNLMGKVMQGQTSALTRVGITFTEAQEAVLKYGNEQERAAMLAEVITNNVGNMNEALGDTPQGKMLQMANTWGDIQENIGNILTSGIYPFLDSLNTMLGYLNTATAKLAEFAQTWAGLSGITLPSVSNSLGEVEENVESVGKATNKTVFGFDNLNKMASQSASGGSGSGQGGALSNLNTSQSTSAIDNVSSSLDKLTRIAKILGDMFGDVFNIGILEPFQNHSDDIRNIFEDLVGFSERITKSFDDFIDRSTTKLDEFSQGRFKVACEEMGQDLDNALETFFDGYDKYIQPTIDRVVENFEEVFGEGGTLDQSFDDVLENLAIVMENSGWLMEAIAILGVLVGIIFAGIADFFVNTVAFIGESIAAGMEMLGGLSLLLEGIFSGSFEKIKEGFALLIQSFIDQLNALISYASSIFGPNSFAITTGKDIGSKLSQPSIATISQRNTSSGGRGTTSTRTSNNDTTVNIVLDKHVLGRATINTNAKNQRVMG